MQPSYSASAPRYSGQPAPQYRQASGFPASGGQPTSRPAASFAHSGQVPSGVPQTRVVGGGGAVPQSCGGAYRTAQPASGATRVPSAAQPQFRSPAPTTQSYSGAPAPVYGAPAPVYGGQTGPFGSGAAPPFVSMDMGSMGGMPFEVLGGFPLDLGGAMCGGAMPLMMGGGGAMSMEGAMGMPGGGMIVPMPGQGMTGVDAKALNMDDLPFSSIGHKSMWQSIFDQVQKEVDAFMESQKNQPQQNMFRIPRLPLPNIHDMQIEMIFKSYDMEGCGELSFEKLSALMADIQCVHCLAMSQHKGEAMAEAHSEMAMMMGPQMAQMMSGVVSQAMDVELAMVKAMACQEIPDEEVRELFQELDADKDGRISKDDFLKNAKKALFDPNPPDEVMQAMEAAEMALASAAGGGPMLLPIDGGFMMLEAGPMMGGPMGGPAMIGGPSPMALPGIPGQSMGGRPVMQSASRLPSQCSYGGQPTQIPAPTAVPGQPTYRMSAAPTASAVPASYGAPGITSSQRVAGGSVQGARINAQQSVRPQPAPQVSQPSFASHGARVSQPGFAPAQPAAGVRQQVPGAAGTAPYSRIVR